MDFFERFIATLEKNYPESARVLNLKTRVSPLLACPEKIQLPRALREQADRIVQAFFELRSVDERARALENLPPAIPDPGNTSILMSYDFHVDQNGQLRLIEINTNASLSLVADAIFETHGLTNSFSKSFRDEIVACFFEEGKQARGKDVRNIAIVDQDPENQKMFVEFVFYQELLKRRGFDVRIGDVGDCASRAGD